MQPCDSDGADLLDYPGVWASASPASQDAQVFHRWGCWVKADSSGFPQLTASWSPLTLSLLVCGLKGSMRIRRVNQRRAVSMKMWAIYSCINAHAWKRRVLTLLIEPPSPRYLGLWGALGLDGRPVTLSWSGINGLAHNLTALVFCPPSPRAAIQPSLGGRSKILQNRVTGCRTTYTRWNTTKHAQDGQPTAWRLLYKRNNKFPGTVGHDP